MGALIRRHLTYANVMATLAVFIALGGSAFAASYVITRSSQIKDGAVTSSDVKNSSLTGSDVKDSGLTSSDIKNSSLTGSDIKDKSLAPSDFNGSVQGPPGPQGPAGPQGTKGASGVVDVISRAAGGWLVDPGATGFATAQCYPGERAVGGGVTSGSSGPDDHMRMIESFPVIAPGSGSIWENGTPIGWTTKVLNGSSSAMNYVAIVTCVPLAGSQ